MQMQQPGIYAGAPIRQQRTQHAFSSWLGMVALALLTAAVVGVGLAWLQWSSQRAITLGYPMPEVHLISSVQGTVAVGQSVQFSANAVGRDLTYDWYFGDDQSSASSEVVNHTFTSYGNVNVSVEVKDAIGRTGYDSTYVNVLPTPPSATFSWTEEMGYYGGYDQIIDFDASGSAVHTSTATYNWDFGDGNTDSTSSPMETHNYYYTGSYNVTLTVVDAANQQNSYTLTVTVQ